VPGAQVTLTITRTGIVRTQAADSSGLAGLTALTAGDYQLSVKADAFRERKAVTLTVGQVATIAIQLGIAAIKQSVAVSESSAATVETDKTETSQVNPNADRSVGDNDIRHRFVFSVLADSPSEWPAPLRSFKVSLLNTIQSPR
jgi:hypothetical protein